MVRIQGARTALELGTLGGYSTIWLARALPPDDRLTATAVQTVGSKGYDGFSLALATGP